jgi:hypothetical protein
MTNVAGRFNGLLANLRLTAAQNEDGETKHLGVRTCLNICYYGLTSGYSTSMLAGSWGKSTAIRPPRDVDVIFVLPSSVYERFKRRTGNIQSQILQEVKSVLSRTYSTTTMRGDGQVVVIPFVTFPVELVPAFLSTNKQYCICNTHDGGTFKTIDPDAEIEKVRVADAETKGNARNLIRMLKCWQGYCKLPMKSFCLELLAMDFLSTWQYRESSATYYDWMTRDFFRYLLGKKWSCVYAPGTYESIPLGSDWESKAQSAYDRAAKACNFESQDQDVLAGEEWQKIFGTDIPRRSKS